MNLKSCYRSSLLFCCFRCQKAKKGAKSPSCAPSLCSCWSVSRVSTAYCYRCRSCWLPAVAAAWKLAWALPAMEKRRQERREERRERRGEERQKESGSCWLLQLLAGVLASFYWRIEAKKKRKEKRGEGCHGWPTHCLAGVRLMLLAGLLCAAAGGPLLSMPVNAVRCCLWAAAVHAGHCCPLLLVVAALAGANGEERVGGWRLQGEGREKNNFRSWFLVYWNQEEKGILSQPLI